MNLRSISSTVYFCEKSIALHLTSLFMLSSCVSQQSVEYLQNKSNDTILAYGEASIDNYKIQPDDELLIQVNSLDDPFANVFLASSAQQPVNSGSVQPYGASLVSYTVDKEGYLALPVIGRISVTGKTLSEINETITTSLTKVLRQPTVNVKLVSRYVSVLGEVRNPGRFSYSQEKMTILDALGMAGDITDYGNRKEVILVRSENGINQRVVVNLACSDVLSSGYFYIRPNDIVYVKPLQRKFWDLRLFPYGTILSALTATILMWSLLD